MIVFAQVVLEISKIDKSPKIGYNNDPKGRFIIIKNLPMIALFFVGIAEMVIIAAWTKMVSDNKILASGVITLINIITWYYVLERILQDLGNWKVVAFYATGCAIGTMLTTWYFQVKEKKEAIVSSVQTVSLES